MRTQDKQVANLHQSNFTFSSKQTVKPSNSALLLKIMAIWNHHEQSQGCLVQLIRHFQSQKMKAKLKITNNYKSESGNSWRQPVAAGDCNRRSLIGEGAQYITSRLNIRGESAQQGRLGGQPDQVVASHSLLYLSSTVPKVHLRHSALRDTLLLMSASAGWHFKLFWGVGLNGDLPKIFYFRVYLGQRLVGLLPLGFEVFVVFSVGGLSVEVFVVPLHLGDALVLLHHLLEVAAALGG